MAPWWKPPMYVHYSSNSGRIELWWFGYPGNTFYLGRESDCCWMVPGTVDPLDDDYSPID